MNCTLIEVLITLVAGVPASLPVEMKACLVTMGVIVNKWPKKATFGHSSLVKSTMFATITCCIIQLLVYVTEENTNENTRIP